MADKTENLHKDHRTRLKNRFLKEGLDNFEPHNVLELLLFFSIPQCDTNELAHTLLNRFGSIPEVFNAPFEELIKIDGVGSHTATLIKLIPALFSIYLKEKTESKKRPSFTSDSAAEYLIPFYITAQVEIVRALYFDNRMNLLENVVIFKGDVNSANLSHKDIAKIALVNNYPNVIIAHNHPNGIPVPSLEDINTTLSLQRSLKMLNINLVEHILIADNQYSKILEFINRERRP